MRMGEGGGENGVYTCTRVKLNSLVWGRKVYKESFAYTCIIHVHVHFTCKS